MRLKLFSYKKSLKGKQHLFVAKSLTPIMILFIVFSFFPIIFAIFLSFHKYHLLSPDKPFVGLQQYIKIWYNAVTRLSIKNSFIFASIVVPTNILITLPLALFINSVAIPRLRAFFRVSYFLPTVISLVATALVWSFLYQPNLGLFNTILKKIGLPGQKWLRSTQLVLPSIGIAYVWRDMGYNLLIFIAALEGLPKIYYEAARIDGAGWWNIFWRITLPLLSPVMSLVVVLTTIDAFQVFDLMYLMPRPAGGPINASRVLVLDIYKNAFDYLKMGYAAAGSVILFSILLILTLIQLKVLKRTWEY